ncbi:hypothetical protein [Bacillus inaquosorum]|uniref:hypothetical protein n=1 Tax=Bacillus inaquosorum TaxID=483913 RepID=UPI00227EFB2B|nr:hypothetical protein [Bacillus inaquosorum]MCY8056490.1 hypothetical protein [Bacillus inaquosorum]MCY9397643.1 hypothetical protein [Bacillus inaquosorum]
MSLFGLLFNILGILYIVALVLVLFFPEKRRERIKEYLLLIMLYPPIFAYNNLGNVDKYDDLTLVFFVFIIHATIFVTLLAWILNNEEKQQQKRIRKKSI